MKVTSSIQTSFSLQLSTQPPSVQTSLPQLPLPDSKGWSQIQKLRTSPAIYTKDLTDLERASNYETQRLMSAYNQSETQSLNVQKKMEDSSNTTQQKVS